MQWRIRIANLFSISHLYYRRRSHSNDKKCLIGARAVVVWTVAVFQTLDLGLDKINSIPIKWKQSPSYTVHCTTLYYTLYTAR